MNKARHTRPVSARAVVPSRRCEADRRVSARRRQTSVKPAAPRARCASRGGPLRLVRAGAASIERARRRGVGERVPAAREGPSNSTCAPANLRAHSEWIRSG